MNVFLIEVIDNGRIKNNFIIYIIIKKIYSLYRSIFFY